MPAILASTDDLKTYLGLDADDTSSDTALQLLLDLVEGQLLADAKRVDRPFSHAQLDRVEVQAGTGTALLWLDYPIDDVLELSLGRDANTAVILDPSDVSIVSWQIGRNLIARVDGEIWGVRDDPAVVRIKYAAQADKPLQAKLAVLYASTVLFRQFGSEDAKSERIATYNRELSTAMRGNSIWDGALRTLRVSTLA